MIFAALLFIITDLTVFILLYKVTGSILLKNIKQKQIFRPVITFTIYIIIGLVYTFKSGIPPVYIDPITNTIHWPSYMLFMP